MSYHNAYKQVLACRKERQMMTARRFLAAVVSILVVELPLSEGFSTPSLPS